MDRADVAIVGAGAAGCSVAAHLLRLEPALRVALLDAQHVGAGSTSRSMAAFRHQWSVPAHVAFSRYGSQEYDRLAGRGHPIQFRRNGYLFLYTDPTAFAHAAARAERQARLGVEGIAVLAPDEIAARVPGGDILSPDRLAGAIWGPRDGFLDPLAVAQAYLEEARGAGARYLHGKAVIGLDAAGGRIRGVEREGGDRLAAPVVVNAAGVWAPTVARLAGLDLPVVPAKRYLYHSRPIRSRPVSGWPLIIGDRGAHFRPEEGNSLVFGWEDRPRPARACPDAGTLWSGQDAIDPGFGLGAEDYGMATVAELARLVPCLAEDVALARVTCGWYEMTPDAKAILGEDPRLPGLHHATGFSGHGIMHAAATGRMLAEAILGREPTLVSPAEREAEFGLGPLLDGRLREPVEEMVL